MNLKNKRGITLITLVITIIILLILAGITISTLTGDNGLFARAQQAKRITRYESAKETINTKLMEIRTNCYANNVVYDIKEIFEEMKQADNITIEKCFYSESANIKNGVNEDIINLNGIIVSVNDYNEYKFLIDKNGNIQKVKYGEINENTDLDDFIDIKDFEKNNFNKNNNTENEKIAEYKFENVEKSNVKIYNGNILENGIEFNGRSTYGTLELPDMQFPMSIEISIKAYQKQGAILYIDPKSKTTIYVGDYFTCTVNNSAETYKVPEDFFDGSLKNVVVTYNSITDFNIYVNGIKLEKYGKKSTISTAIPTLARIGSRDNINFFNGIIYNFRVYNKILDESEILTSYTSDKNNVENNTEQIVRNNIIYKLTMSKIIDSTNNQENMNIINGESNEKKNGCIFNGESTYAQMDLKELTFPMTIEMNIRCYQKKNEILYIDQKSKTAIYVGDYFTCTVNDLSETYKVPKDFFDGNLKNIVITYNTITDFNIYVNGNKLEKYGKKSSLTVNLPSTSQIGARLENDYFNGVFYDFTIYKGILNDSDILKNYKEKTKRYDI